MPENSIRFLQNHEHKNMHLYFCIKIRISIKIRHADILLKVITLINHNQNIDKNNIIF